MADFFSRTTAHQLGIRDGDFSEALPHDPGRKLVLNRLYLRQFRHQLPLLPEMSKGLAGLFGS